MNSKVFVTPDEIERRPDKPTLFVDGWKVPFWTFRATEQGTVEFTRLGFPVFKAMLQLKQFGWWAALKAPGKIAQPTQVVFHYTYLPTENLDRCPMKQLTGIEKMYADEDAFRARNMAKMGDYENPKDGCPNCGRHRIMHGDDGKHRCEKCAWCIEDNNYDGEFLEFLG